GYAVVRMRASLDSLPSAAIILSTILRNEAAAVGCRRGLVADGGPDQPDDGDRSPPLRWAAGAGPAEERDRGTAADFRALPAAGRGAPARHRPAAVGHRPPFRHRRPHPPRRAAGA